MISGFLLYRQEETKTNVARVIDLWFTVMFYGVVTTIVFSIVTNNLVTNYFVIKSLFPLLSSEYWYFSSYIGVFFLSRLINNGIRKTDDRTLKRYIGVIIVFFCAFETLSSHLYKGSETTSQLLNGYSFAWLLIMYILGAIIKKTSIHERIKNSTCLITVLLLVMFSFVWMMYLGPLFFEPMLFVEYTSPTIVLVALCALCIFSKIELPLLLRRVLDRISKSIFSIYLINSHPLIAYYLINDKNLNFLLKYSGIRLVIVVLIISVLFSIVSVMIDQIRIIVFNFLKIDLICKRIEKLFYKATDYL